MTQLLCKQDAMIVLPTGTLASQIAEVAAKLGVPFVKIIAGQKLDVKTVPNRREYSTKRGFGGLVLFVVTPGAGKSAVEKFPKIFGKVGTFILDEFDEMLSPSFLEDVEILHKASKASKTSTKFPVVGSATASAEVIEQIRTLFGGIEFHEVCAPTSAETSTIMHVPALVDDLNDATLEILKLRHDKTAIFCATKKGVSDVAGLLNNAGFSVILVTGDLTPKEQGERVQNFKLETGSKVVLVCSGVMGRGFDCEGLGLVILYGLPNKFDDFKQFTGRTGRAGKRGGAIVLVTPDELKRVRLLGQIYRFIMETGARLPGQGVFMPQFMIEQCHQVYTDGLQQERVNAAAATATLLPPLLPIWLTMLDGIAPPVKTAGVMTPNQL